jgi:hypothetical protein
VYQAGDFTRPRDDKSYQRPPKLGKNEGYYLDLKNAFHYGTAPDEGSPDVYDRAPTYYEVNCADADGQNVPLDVCASHKIITYWFSYGYSTAFERDLFAHEGDWEHINVHLSEDGERATQVDYFAHHDPATPMSYGEVEKEGTHPVVYSARASHASYPTEGIHPVNCPDWVPGEGDCGIDQAVKGRQWRTWESVEPVKEESWYGFGGAWGRIGAGTGPVALDTTGPLGPSPYKDPFGHG